jgi:hypothetical protein
MIPMGQHAAILQGTATIEANICRWNIKKTTEKRRRIRELQGSQREFLWAYGTTVKMF